MKDIHKTKKWILPEILLLLFASCSQDFQEINTDPAIISTPKPEWFLSGALADLNNHGRDKGYYNWINLYSGLGLSQQYCGSRGGGGYGGLSIGAASAHLYSGIGPRVVELRNILNNESQEEQDRYKNVVAISHIIQVYEAINVSDLYGSIVYSQGFDGRRTGILDPKYDTQEELYTKTLPNQLNTAIKLLKESKTRKAEGKPLIDIVTLDYIYSGDLDKWIKTANALKLRLALRCINGAAKPFGEKLIKEAIDGGLYESRADEFLVAKGKDFGFGSIPDSKPAGAYYFIEFLKKTNDPRLPIFFEQNEFDPANIKTMMDAGVFPSNYIDITKPLFRYQGGYIVRNAPTQGDIDRGKSITVGGKGYSIISSNNRRLIKYDYNNGDGEPANILISYAEMCLVRAELIWRGYVQGDYTDWYEKGVTASLQMYDFIAEKQKVQTAYNDVVADEKIVSRIEDAHISDYLSKPEVKLTGDGSLIDLEKIFLQQYINFHKDPKELGILMLRSGYPSTAPTAVFEWKDWKEQNMEHNSLGRRLQYTKPTILITVDTWKKAMEEQGYIPEPPKEDYTYYNRVRSWWDKPNPDYGTGHTFNFKK